MSDRLFALWLFARIARKGSFSAAGQMEKSIFIGEAGALLT
jgi:hypothetical protein